jgi:phosphorylcholine metabolism protein LicD
MPEIPDHKTRNVGSDIYGAARLELAKLVKRALDGVGVVWFLDGGTLLGAHRNGKQLAHDDDFDIATYSPDFKGVEDLIALKQSMTPFLPAQYEIRTVTTYASKLEIYDRASASYALPMPQYKAADFHTVTVDVQVMTKAADGFVVYLHDMLLHVRVPQESIEPVGQINCEGTAFNCPHETVRFLEAQYGYIGADARYDTLTKMYVKEDPSSPI